jgi:hypothetical protein
MYWYYSNGGLQQGPITEEEITRLILDAGISAETLVWNETLPSWIKLSESTLAPHLEKRYAPAPQVVPVPPPLPGVAAPEIEQIPREEKASPMIPPIPITPTSAKGISWYYRENGQSVGPVEEDEIIRLHASGRISDKTPLWNDSLPDWLPLSGTKLASLKNVPVPTGEISFSDADILEIATRQRNTYRLIVGGFFGAILVNIFLISIVPSPLGKWIWWTVLVAFGAVYLFQVYKLAVAIKSKWVWLYIVLQFVPFPLVGLVTTFFLGDRGSKILKSRGLKIGFLGASSSDMTALKARVGMVVGN